MTLSRTGRFAATSVALLPVLLLIRLYELMVVRSAHVLPAAMGSVLVGEVQSDLAVTLWTAAIAAVPIAAIAWRRPWLAERVHRALLVVVALLSVALVQYFAVTFVPLGADFFGYSWADIRETTLSSRGIGVTSLLPFGCFGTLTWIVTGLAARLRVTPTLVKAFLGAMTLSVLLERWVGLAPEHFASDSAYFLADNKAAYFIGRAFEHFARRSGGSATGPALANYPLLHAASNEDVLGPLLETGGPKPNLVLIIVEGLGRDFVGEHAAYGGFTPFLDSLTKRSLYWDNFHSTSGRTFGILPALLGSLPFGENGFMELGARMPRHLTLMSLLHERGYQANYFTGTEGHYDNIDTFVRRQGVDQFIDMAKFGAGYEKQPAGEGGFSWGYGDRELFRKSFEVLGSRPSEPRLDVYMTITTHEPFIPPNTAKYAAEFERRLGALPVEPTKRDEYRKYAGVFASLLYTDDAIRYFLGEYARRPEFAHTIFLITGDHRLIPVPQGTRADRYHVPLIIFSPMVRAPRRFSSVSSHFDVTPSVLAMLQARFGMHFPQQVPWMGSGLDTATAFRNMHSVPLMRTKNTLDEYLDGTSFLSGDQLFTLCDNYDLLEVQDASRRSQVSAKLERFRQLNAFVTSGDHIYPGGATDSAGALRAVLRDSVFRSLGLEPGNSGRAFDVARERAIARDFTTARTIARLLLQDQPDYHDARTLLGRTYGWDHQPDSARAILREVVRRAPDFSDAYSALVDVEIWGGNGAEALRQANAAIVRFPGNADLLVDKARALELLGRKAEARAVIDAVLRRQPSHADARTVRKRLAG